MADRPVLVRWGRPLLSSSSEGLSSLSLSTSVSHPPCNICSILSASLVWGFCTLPWWSQCSLGRRWYKARENEVYKGSFCCPCKPLNTRESSELLFSSQRRSTVTSGNSSSTLVQLHTRRSFNSTTRKKLNCSLSRACLTASTSCAENNTSHWRWLCWLLGPWFAAGFRPPSREAVVTVEMGSLAMCKTIFDMLNGQFFPCFCPVRCAVSYSFQKY